MRTTTIFSRIKGVEWRSGEGGHERRGGVLDISERGWEREWRGGIREGINLYYTRQQKIKIEGNGTCREK